MVWAWVERVVRRMTEKGGGNAAQSRRDADAAADALAAVALGSDPGEGVAADPVELELRWKLCGYLKWREEEHDPALAP